jgi:hypothetical protein
MWNSDHEKLFSNICNFAQQKSLIHIQAYTYYFKWDVFFQIQIILLSAIAGTFSFLTGYFPNNKTLLVVIGGFLSYYITIISSIYKYFKISQLLEQHISAHKSWQKLYNNIKVELDLNNINRTSVNDFQLTISCEYNRLNEISPIIPLHLIKHFESKNRTTISVFRFTDVAQNKSTSSISTDSSHEPSNESV